MDSTKATTIPMEVMAAMVRGLRPATSGHMTIASIVAVKAIIGENKKRCSLTAMPDQTF
jgi:hypothetical protein